MEETQQQPGQEKKRNFIVALVALIFILIGCVWFAYWYFYSSHFETTEDSYVEGNILPIVSKIPSTVMLVHADVGHLVEAGELLAELSDFQQRAQLDQAQAALASTVRQTYQLFQKLKQAELNQDLRKVQLDQAQLMYQHRSQLRNSGAVAGEEISQAQVQLEAAKAQYALSQSQYKEAFAQVQGTSIATHPLVQQARATYIQAALNIKNTKLFSPQKGMIVQRHVDIGQTVAPGSTLFTLIPLSEIRVVANFKETQLRKIRPGQAASMEVDMYGGHHHFKGVVSAVTPATGTSMSLLPPQNATGNWVKVVQRVPVHITLIPEKETPMPPLLLGLSVATRIHLDKSPYPLIPKQNVENEFKIARLIKDPFEEAENKADAIILENVPNESALHERV